MLPTALTTFLLFLKVWWWLILPFILVPLFLRAWLWWRQHEVWQGKQEYILLELIPPPEILQPISAMEHVFSALWGIYSGIRGISHFRKRWLIGRRLNHFCFEIVSFGPHPHFFVRLLKQHRDTFESAMYSQFPDMEIVEAKDYLKYITWNVPNKDWQMYGMDMILVKPDVYPIKTYRMFFEERPEMIKEEKRIDPLPTLLEGMSTLKENEEMLWVQMRIEPVSSHDDNYVERGKRLVDKLVFRTKKAKSLITTLLTGASGEEEEKSFIPPEMKLTPREKEIVKAIEDKISKPAFRCNIRTVYLSKPEIFRFGRRALAEQFFNTFATRDLNAIKKWSKTKTRVWHFFIDRRLYVRRRRIFQRYLLGETPLYPLNGGTYILNTEELATLFHLPLAVGRVGTLLPRVRVRKVEAPPELEEVEREYQFPIKPAPKITYPKREAPPELPTENSSSDKTINKNEP